MINKAIPNIPNIPNRFHPIYRYMNTKCFYGIENKYIDITTIVLNFIFDQENPSRVFNFPIRDHDRAVLFGDPAIGKDKHILIKNELISIRIPLGIEFLLNSSAFEDINELQLCNDKKWFIKYENNPKETLDNIHKNINLKFGDVKREYPEQLLSVEFISPNSKVLELGANIGRNSFCIATMLESFKNLVSLEPNTEIFNNLKINMNINGYKFNAENLAISEKRLIQKGWHTIPSEIVLDGYTPVKITSINYLQEKYNIQFDTLVADCEGALYYILCDTPEFLDNFNLLIIENDYPIKIHRNEVEKIILKSGFKKIKQVKGGEGSPHFSDSFLEVWKK